MSTRVSENIRISIKPTFHQEHSSPLQQEYIFTYQILIENKGHEHVQLLRRHWYIYDSCGKYSEVEGEGVIGQQPIISPDDHHEYISTCVLTTDMGMMWGTYLMRSLDSKKLFEVKIPEFQLIVPYRLN